jgi:hypothetical protein
MNYKGFLLADVALRLYKNFVMYALNLLASVKRT